MDIISKFLNADDIAILKQIVSDGKYGTYDTSYGRTGQYETYRVAMGSVFKYVNVFYNGLPETLITENGKLIDGDWERYQEQHDLVMSSIDVHTLQSLNAFRLGHGVNFERLSQIISEFEEEMKIKNLIHTKGPEAAYKQLVAEGKATDKLFFL